MYVVAFRVRSDRRPTKKKHENFTHTITSVMTCAVVHLFPSFFPLLFILAILLQHSFVCVSALLYFIMFHRTLSFLQVLMVFDMSGFFFCKFKYPIEHLVSFVSLRSEECDLLKKFDIFDK